MASELRVNTLKDSAQATLCWHEFVAEGSAKRGVYKQYPGTILFRTVSMELLRQMTGRDLEL